MTICKGCGKDDELRFGYCFDCAHSGERRAACRTVWQHVVHAFGEARKGYWKHVQYDLSWAWQRLTRTGDYAKDGTFDWEGHPWRGTKP